jgi:hypothetical protein
MANTGPIHENFHLFRLRVPLALWEELGVIAELESKRRGEYVCRSDIARFALKDWVEGWRASERLGALSPPDRQPS